MPIDQEALHQTLRQVNRFRRSNDRPGREAADRLMDLLFQASRRVAVYGSLAPGEMNHRVVAHLQGEWSSGFVQGHLEDRGWGTGIGFPGLRWDPSGRKIPVRLLSSPGLPDFWPRLDEFEGSAYRRILVPVYGSETGVQVANLYELAAPET